MELVIAAGCDIHHRDQLGQQAINWASSSPMNIDAARWLLARGANPSAASRDGMTPLHYAARNGSIEMARLFLDAGADAEALADSGGDPRKLDPMGVALIWLGIHQNSDLVTLLSDAKSFAQAQRVAEKERQELGAAASPSSAPRQILAPRI